MTKTRGQRQDTKNNHDTEASRSGVAAAAAAAAGTSSSWNNIASVSMISPSFRAQISEPSFLCHLDAASSSADDENDHGEFVREEIDGNNNDNNNSGRSTSRRRSMGMYLEVEITPSPPFSSSSLATAAAAAAAASASSSALSLPLSNNSSFTCHYNRQQQQKQQHQEEQQHHDQTTTSAKSATITQRTTTTTNGGKKNYCHEFGILLYQLYSGRSNKTIASSASSSITLGRQFTYDDDAGAESSSIIRGGGGGEVSEQQQRRQQQIIHHQSSATFDIATQEEGEEEEEEEEEEPLRKMGGGKLYRMMAQRQQHQQKLQQQQCRQQNKRQQRQQHSHTNYHASLQEMGFPTSICLLVQNLVDSSSSHMMNHAAAAAYYYPSLEEASIDIHRMLNDPDCYLFDYHDYYHLCGYDDVLRDSMKQEQERERQQQCRLQQQKQPLQQQQQQQLKGESNAIGSGIAINDNPPNNSTNSNNGSRSSSRSNGVIKLRTIENKVYGRENEMQLITESFCRVSEGKSEAFFIGGYSGSGKTMLVQSVMARVRVAGGYVVTQKVDQMSKERPLLEVLAAFNKLCLLIKNETSRDELRSIKRRLSDEFETDWSILARLLPNVNALCSPREQQRRTPSSSSGGKSSPSSSANGGKDASSVSATTSCADHQIHHHLAHNSHFTLQRFMNIVSSKERPVMLFLDDLQWASKSALDLIHAILSSDTRCARARSAGSRSGSATATCFFFVGSYRDNEVGDDHPLMEMMCRLKDSSSSGGDGGGGGGGSGGGVTTTTVNLSGGLHRDNLNVMISEMLCLFPRLCKSLSDIVFEKTGGNPFFALEFLKSLVDNGLLKYSLRERRWTWDEPMISSENITDNVLYLLTNKMSSLPENVQRALKILSCFGIKTNETIVRYLSLADPRQLSGLEEWINLGIRERCIQKVGYEYKFVHDKVREAVYGLIPDSEKAKFHHDIGMLLYSISKNEGLIQEGDAIFHIVDQINHGLSLVQPQMKLNIAELNTLAGSVAIGRSDFTTAYSYLTCALSLLPENHWNLNYEFSLRLYFLRSRAAYSCGNTEEAIESLKTILEEGHCIGDKLDAHHYYLTILNASEKRIELYISCRKVLSELNESIPDSIDTKSIADVVQQTADTLKEMTDDDWLTMKEMESSTFKAVLKFYTAMVDCCYLHKPELLFFICCRMIHITLEHGVCGDSVVGFVQFTSLLCQRSNIGIPNACRIGKAAMCLLSNRFDSPELMAKLCLSYYAFVAIHDSPIQSCVDKLRSGYKVAMAIGNTALAFNIAVVIIRMAMHSGETLSPLLEETDYYLEQTSRFDHKVCKTYLTIYREVMSTLIDRGASTSPPSGSERLEDDAISSTSAYSKAFYVHRALQSFWLGYTERCQHYVEKLLQMKMLGSHNQFIIRFYGTINAFSDLKSKKAKASRIMKAKKLCLDAIRVFKSAAKLSPSNYSNKVQLLEAVRCSFDKKNDAAKTAFNEAISLSCSANLIHDQGLAAELAAFHFLEIGDIGSARNLFAQAKQCYAEWGSQMKVDFITCQLEKM